MTDLLLLGVVMGEEIVALATAAGRCCSYLLLAVHGAKDNGSVVTWGAGGGGDSNLVSSQLESGVVEIVAAVGAFAALEADSSVVAWGILIMSVI